MKFYYCSKEDTLKYLNSNLEYGLTSDEVRKRVAEYGLNQIQEKARKGMVVRFLGQFKNTMIWLLLAVAVVSLVSAIIYRDFSKLNEPILIVLIVAMNVVLGIIQEQKTTKAMNALKKDSIVYACVLRDGKEEKLEAINLVPGDILLLEPGDRIPADARLLQSNQLKCEESALTGTSLPVEKDADAQVREDADLREQINMLFNGCTIICGSAVAIVTATGMDSEKGKIASLLNEGAEIQMPFQQSLSKLIQYLGIVAISACILVFIIGFIWGMEMMEILNGAISIVVAAIPEGFPVLLSIALFLGMMRMMKRHVKVHNLSVIEKLGRTSVICFDKNDLLEVSQDEDIKKVIEFCQKAQIKPILMSVDEMLDLNMAKEFGILCEGDEILSGCELDRLSDGELLEYIEKIAVYTGVTMEHKIRIVKTWQRKRHVVAISGDGMKDAPILKVADVACAMGKTAKDVADITITDKSILSMMSIIKAGRGIYAHLKKIVAYLLGGHIGEVMLVFIAMLLWQTSALIPLQLLWINLIIISLPAIALGMEHGDRKDTSPQMKSKSIFARGYRTHILFQGFLFGCISLIAFYIGNQYFGIEGGQTMSFYVLSMSQIVQSFHLRSPKSIFKMGIFSNSALNHAVLISIGCTLLLLFTPLSLLFGLIPLTPTLYIVGAGLFILPSIVVEITKLLNQ